MATILVVVADSARARLFRKSELGLQEFETLSQRGAGLKEQELTTDRAGRFRSAGSFGHSGDPVSASKQATLVFARGLIDRLESLRNTSAFDELIVIAAPEFMGLLRQSMPKALARRISLEINKDLASFVPTEIEDIVATHEI